MSETETSPKARRYRVRWIAHNGKSGRGSWTTREKAEKWAKWGNEQNPSTTHLVESE